MREWTTCTVADIKAPIQNALATGPFGSAISSRFFVDTGVPVIRGSNLSQEISTRLIDEGLVFIAPDKAQEFSRSFARRGDLIFTCWGTIDQVGLIDSRSMFDTYIVSNKQMKLTPDPEKADSLFLYYLFSNPEVRAEIVNRGIGTSVPGFNLGQLKSIPLLLPPVDEQRTIAHILGTLDDKIELNRRTNETLEAMARAIFKSWFVDFDPVRAKASGEPPESICRRLGLTHEHLALFPDGFEDSGFDGIPLGWNMATLSDFSELNAKSWSAKTLPGQINYVDLANTKNGVIQDVQTFTSSDAPSRARRILRSGDTIIGTVRPGNKSFALVGPRDVQLTGSTGFAVLSPAENYLTEIVYMAATAEENIERLARLADGGAYPAVLPEIVVATKCVQPSESVAKAFHCVVAPLMKMYDANTTEIDTLAGLRDSLLPKLLSGDLAPAELTGACV